MSQSDWLVTPEMLEWFRRDQTRRIMAEHDRSILDSLGNPLLRDEPTMGTFSNQPASPSLVDLAQALEAVRRAQYSPQLDRPKRIEFGSVAVAGFWLSIQNIEHRRLPRDIDAFGCPIDECEVSIQALVPDRDTGKPVGITFKYRFPAAAWDNEQNRAEILRAVIRKWLAHEVDEHIFVDGKRPFEPHNAPPLSFLEPELPEQEPKYFAGYRRVRP